MRIGINELQWALSAWIAKNVQRIRIASQQDKCGYGEFLDQLSWGDVPQLYQSPFARLCIIFEDVKKLIRFSPGSLFLLFLQF